jgi:hypothetical protein
LETTTPSAPASRDEPRRLELRGHKGIRLVADAFGDPDAPPVLLMHGGGQTRYAWGATASRLAAAGFYAVTLDLRGHGESAWADDGDYDITAFAADIFEVTPSFPRVPRSSGRLSAASRASSASTIIPSRRLSSSSTSRRAWIRTACSASSAS